MLIYNLFKTLSDEVQYSESRLDCVSPDVNINKANTVIVPDKFREGFEPATLTACILATSCSILH